MTYGDALAQAIAATFVTLFVVGILLMVGTMIYDDYGGKGLAIFFGTVLGAIAYFNLVALFIYLVIQ